ncbi:MAG: extracellular solute-binding protein [Erysipelotrichales bacterium]|nr:extracellular solute-binding protein [Erysipelotrichales bacterium]
MKKLFRILLASALVLGLAACGGDTNKGNNDEGSKSLVVYSPNSDSLINSVIPAYEEKYGITVEVITMGTGECLTRIDSEKENPQADVIFGGMTAGNYENYPDLWEQYVSPYDADLEEEYQNYKGYVSRYALDGSAALLLNLDVFADLGLNPDEFTGYADLLDPALKGKIAMGNPAKSSSAWAELTNMLLVMGNEPYDDAAWEWVESFIANLDGIIIDSSSAIYKGVSAGEYAVGVSYEDPCVSLLVDGATNVKLVYPEEGAVWLPAGSAIIKNAPNMENAKLFIDFMQSEEGQQVIATTTARPVNTSINNTAEEMTPFSEIHVVYEDMALTAEKKSEWQQKWLDLVQQ